MMRKSSVFLRKGGASLARNGYRVNPGTGLLAARRRAGYLQRAYPSRATEQDDQLSSPWPRDRKFESTSLQHGVKCEPDFRRGSRRRLSEFRLMSVKVRVPGATRIFRNAGTDGTRWRGAGTLARNR
jgi:hypothetical protein